MQMKQQEAFKVFGMSEGSSKEQILARFKELAKKYHPDLGGSEEMMKILNDAMDCLRHYNGSGHTASFTESNFGEILNNAINSIKGCVGLEIEVCGTWIWVGGNTFANKEILKSNGFMFSKSKRKWYFIPGGTFKKRRGRCDMDQIRSIHGSQKVEMDQVLAIA